MPRSGSSRSSRIGCMRSSKRQRARRRLSRWNRLRERCPLARRAPPDATPMLRKIWPYLRNYRWQVVWALAQVFLIAGFELLKPWPLQVVIDYVLGGKQPPTAGLVSAVLALPQGELLVLACIGLVTVTLGSGGLTLLHYYTTI